MKQIESKKTTDQIDREQKEERIQKEKEMCIYKYKYKENHKYLWGSRSDQKGERKEDRRGDRTCRRP